MPDLIPKDQAVKNLSTINNSTQNQEDELTIISYPNHLGIIPDGNRRYTKLNKVATTKSHDLGQATITPIIGELLEKTNIPVMTIWAISPDNLNRPQKEVDAIFKATTNFVRELLPFLHKYNCKIRRIGNTDKVPKELIEFLDRCESETSTYSRVFNIAINYGGRWDILNAINQWLKQNPGKTEITEEELGKHMEILKDNYPAPDLIFRSGSDSVCKRTSGLFPWQSIYTEYYFTEKMLPELTFEDVRLALEEYGKANRRFGK